MPYIEPEGRPTIDAFVEALGPFIVNEGDLNYTITRLMLRFLISKGLKYSMLSTIVGTIHLVSRELERRIVDAYEDLKIVENGDVREYAELREDISELKLQRDAKQTMKEALVLVQDVLKGPELTEELAKQGLRIDYQSLFNAFSDTLGVPRRQFIVPK